MSKRWYKVCPASELKPGGARSIRLLGRRFAVFNINGELRGLDGDCKHMKSSLAIGRMQGPIVECAMHGWRYNVETGACLTNDYGDLRTWPVKVESGAIYIEIELPGLA